MLGVWLASTMSLWALAFAQVHPDAPKWLSSAQAACFGTLSSGLPGAGGWVLLVFAPLSFLIGALVTWPSELREGFRRLRTVRSGRALLWIVASALIWETHWVGARIASGLHMARTTFSAESADELPPDYPRSDREAPRFELVDQTGKRVSLESLRGQTVFLTFAFAHCQTVCPAIVAQSKAALQALDSGQVQLLVVTLDPWRDTPRSLPFLAGKWELPANAHVLSGAVPEVTRVLDLYQVPWKRDEKNGDIAHPALTYVIAPDGRIAYAFGSAPTSWLVESARRTGVRVASYSGE